MTGLIERMTAGGVSARRGGLTWISVVALALVAATIAVGVLEQIVGVADASPVYLIPVVVAAGVLGTWAAVGTSLLGFLVYDFLFTTPRFTFQVSDPAEWLSLLLFLLVAVVIGQLTALLRERAEMADRRAREGVALVAISRDIAMTTSFAQAAAAVTRTLRVDAEMESVWVTLARSPGEVIAPAGPVPGATGATPWTLMRSRADGTSEWLRVHEGRGNAASDADRHRYDVAIEGEGEGEGQGQGDGGAVGWIHATRAADDPMPGRGARRLLELAADQLGIALRREQLLTDLTAAEVARQSDALRGAILDSVSHDLRTPMASIRALAGGLVDPAVDPDLATVRGTAAAIDDEGARLGDLVGSLLDMGRIQAGAVRPDMQACDLAELVETALRHRGRGGSGVPQRLPEVLVPDDLAPVLVDAVLFDVTLGNVLDNAFLHAPRGAAVRVRATATDRDRVLLAVDDAGPGVPPEAIPHLFDRFYRVPATGEPARHGLGMGLAIARGFVEAMGGSIEATASDLGGLSIRMHLCVAPAEVMP